MKSFLKHILCALGFHFWGEWKKVTVKQPNATYEAQSRVCEHCGKRDFKFFGEWE